MHDTGGDQQERRGEEGDGEGKDGRERERGDERIRPNTSATHGFG